MTGFISRSYGNKEFEVIIKTDSKEHYKATEAFARKLIDHEKPKQKPVKKAITQDTLNALAAMGRKAHGEV